MLNDHPLAITNLCSPQPDLLASGMPTAADLENAAKKGIKTVINLCPIEETPPTETEQVASLGMKYVNIPVKGAQDLTPANAQALADIVENCDNHPVLVHCKSANRVGALFALKAFWIDKKSEADALEYGRSAGLLKMEDGVKMIMQQTPSI